MGGAQGRLPGRAPPGVLGARHRAGPGRAAQAPAGRGQEVAGRDHGGPVTQGRPGGAGALPRGLRCKYPKAVAKLDRDWQHLTAFYDFPAEHWRHLRTSNAIESSFATVKLRTRVTKGAGSKQAALAMAYKLLDAAQQRWRRFNGHELVADVLAGATFKEGIRVTDDTNDETTDDEKVAA